jgi:hypothetical protein
MKRKQVEAEAAGPAPLPNGSGGGGGDRDGGGGIGGSGKGGGLGIGSGGEQARERKRASDDGDGGGGEMLEWAVWQLIDPLLPTGGFAHSQGLEAAAHGGLVAGADQRVGRGNDSGWSVEAFALEALRNAASLSVPFVEAARMAFAPLAAPSAVAAGGISTDSTDDEAARGIDAAVRTWLWLDARLSAHLAGNAVASRASTATGAAMMRAVTAAFGSGAGGPGPDNGGVAVAAAAALAEIKRASRPAGSTAVAP